MGRPGAHSPLTVMKTLRNKNHGSLTVAARNEALRYRTATARKRYHDSPAPHSLGSLTECLIPNRDRKGVGALGFSALSFSEG